MILTAKCTACVARNGIVMVLFAIEPNPDQTTEHLLGNLLKSRGELREGATYRITIEEEGDST